MLKPCPFCGNEVYIEKVPLWRTYPDGTTHGYRGKYSFDIRCEKCGCNINIKGNDTLYTSEEKAKENAINAWNKRAFTEKYWQRT